MIISFTGHRPNKLPDPETGYTLPNPCYNYVCQQTEQLLLELKPEYCISGMAIGFDQYAANVCLKLGIPFVAAVPFLGQEKRWKDSTQQAYHSLLNKALRVEIISEGGYSAHKMQIRNQYLVDHCDLLIACWNGDLSGGTYNCLQYAKTQNKEIKLIDPKLCPQ
jgi:uncharacterized phage-like protein YoqJ